MYVGRILTGIQFVLFLYCPASHQGYSESAFCVKICENVDVNLSGFI